MVQEVQNLASGKGQLKAPEHTGGSPARKQTVRKGPGGPAKHQAEPEPVMCPCHKEDGWCPVLH